MARMEIAPEIHDLCESAAARKHLELVDVRLRGSGRNRVLEVIVDHEDGGVSMDLITEVSLEISAALDRGDYIDGRYILEVSSAGLERPLLRPADYHRFTGREIKVRTREPVEGRRLLEGHLRAPGEEAFELELPEGEVVQIGYTSVAAANLKVDWAEELRRLDGGARDSLAAEG